MNFPWISLKSPFFRSFVAGCAHQTPRSFPPLSQTRNKREFISIFYEKYCQPFGIGSEESIKKFFSFLENKKFINTPLLIVHDAGNDLDDQLKIRLIALQVKFGSLDPKKIRIMGIPNPTGADANGVVKEYLARSELSLPDFCYHTAPSATVVFDSTKETYPGFPQEQKSFAFGEDSKQYRKEETRPVESDWYKAVINANQQEPDPLRRISSNRTENQSIWIAGAAASGLIKILVNPETYPEAIALAYRDAVKQSKENNPELPEETWKIILRSDPLSADLRMEPEKYKKTRNDFLLAFDTHLQTVLKKNPQRYLRPDLWDSKNKKSVDLSSVLLQYQGGKNGSGQNQKFRSLARIDGSLVDAKEYASLSKEDSYLPINESLLIETTFQELLGYNLKFFSVQDTVNVTNTLQEQLGPQGPDILDTEMIEAFRIDNQLSKFPGLLLQRSMLKTFFPKTVHPDISYSCSYSWNMNPYRACLETLELFESSDMAKTALQQENPVPKQAITESLRTIEKSTEISWFDSPAENIDRIFDICYPTEGKIHSTYDPRSYSKGNLSNRWEKIGGETPYPTIEEIKHRLKQLANTSETPSDIRDLFALDILRRTAEGFQAQRHCLDHKVIGTQESCRKAVTPYCAKAFLDRFNACISVGPYDLSNALEALDPERTVDRKTAIFLSLVKSNIFRDYIALPA